MVAKEIAQRLRPRRKPFRPVTKDLDLVSRKETPQGTWILARDPWQFYRLFIPRVADSE